MLYLIQKLQVFFFFKKNPKNPCPHFRYSSSIYHLFSLQMHPYERMFNLWNDSLMKVLCRPFVGASLFTFTRGRRTGSSEKWQEEADLISKCKCRPFNSLGYQCGYRCQECVELILSIWFAFALTFPLLDTPLSISLVYHAAPVFPMCRMCYFTFDFYVHTQLLPHALPSISLLTGSCLLLSIHLYFKQFDCSPLLVLVFPVSYFSLCLLTHYLLPLFLPPFGDFTLCCTSPSSLLW